MATSLSLSLSLSLTSPSRDNQLIRSHSIRTLCCGAAGLRGSELYNDLILPFNLLIAGAEQTYWLSLVVLVNPTQKSRRHSQYEDESKNTPLVFILFLPVTRFIVASKADQNYFSHKNEEFIPEDSEDSSTVHVGTAMFCQVGSEVCLHFEVNLLAYNLLVFVLKYFPPTRFSSNRIFYGSHKWPRNSEQRRSRARKDLIYYV